MSFVAVGCRLSGSQLRLIVLSHVGDPKKGPQIGPLCALKGDLQYHSKCIHLKEEESEKCPVGANSKLSMFHY